MGNGPGVLLFLLLLARGSAGDDRRLAPDFILPDVDGRPASVAEYRGKAPVLLVFYRGFW